VYICAVAKWRDEGILEALFQALSTDADMENLSIDFSSIRVHKSANGAFQQHSLHHQGWIKPLWHDGLTLEELKG